MKSGFIPRVAALWPTLAGVASLAMLATAHAFERFAGLPPCALCLRQREIYWVALIVGAAGFAAFLLLRREPWLLRVVSLALAVVFLAGAGVALYHAGAELKWWPGPATCSGGAGPVSGDLLEALSKPITVVRCDEAPWHLLGLSMAGWNMMVSIGLAALSVVAAVINPPRKTA
jgi:disulfide bond formation protein DsbB